MPIVGRSSSGNSDFNFILAQKPYAWRRLVSQIALAARWVANAHVVLSVPKTKADENRGYSERDYDLTNDRSLCVFRSDGPVFEPMPRCRPKFSAFVTNRLFSQRIRRVACDLSAPTAGYGCCCRDSGLAPMSADGPTLRYTPTGAVISVPNEPVETRTKFFGSHPNSRCPLSAQHIPFWKVCCG